LSGSTTIVRFLDVDNDLLMGVDGRARTVLELAVIGLPPTGVGVARIDAHAQSPSVVSSYRIILEISSRHAGPSAGSKIQLQFQLRHTSGRVL